MHVTKQFNSGLFEKLVHFFPSLPLMYPKDAFMLAYCGGKMRKKVVDFSMPSSIFILGQVIIGEDSVGSIIHLFYVMRGFWHPTSEVRLVLP